MPRLNEFVRKLSAIYEVGKSLTSTLDLDEVLRLITRRAAQIMHAKRCTLRLLSSDGRRLTLRAFYGQTAQASAAKGDVRVGESIAGRVVRGGAPIIVKDLFKERRYKGIEFVRAEGIHSLLSVPLFYRKETLGVLSVYARPRDFYRRDDVSLLSMFADQAAIALENARLFAQVRDNYLTTIRALTNVIDAKDSYTYGHSERVMRHAEAIARSLRLKREATKSIKFAGLLHDIGKIGIDAGILRKPGRLTPGEWKEILLHPGIGAKIVEEIEPLTNLSPLILHHHAKFSGGGYPDAHLHGKAIPQGARILAVADSYEAMISARPYRDALSQRRATEELILNSGRQFDPEVVRAFLKVINH